ncbi:hypothetical protein F7725_016428 [Dissostichus mawsoni]|uniref:Uncharacterized protein n=1 Tax=Dissostichus mawsoni TaxID=36200 RepID=A0A7J5Z1L1_DISMA|nr:hypothetical protein F7725_016428 [Dissostichus mawsoni]
MAALKAEVLILRFTILFLCSSVCLCQRDCTGVDCPQLDNCIEEVLDSGSCCASCLQKGCMCEGYQYYDCLHAGFKNGKVAEGESYLLTTAAQSASAQQEEEESAVTSSAVLICRQTASMSLSLWTCERVGCIYDEQKYDAGHSLNTDPCQVCHCPPEGGKMMCYPVPECDKARSITPMLSEPTDEDKHNSYAERFDQQGRTDQFSTPHQLPPNLPLFKTPPSEGILPLMKEESEDYDYNPTDFPEPYPQSLAFPPSPLPPKRSYLCLEALTEPPPLRALIDKTSWS